MNTAWFLFGVAVGVACVLAGIWMWMFVISRR